MVIFHSYVKLPEGTPFTQGKQIPVFHPHGHLFYLPLGQEVMAKLGMAKIAAVSAVPNASEVFSREP